MGHVKKVHCCKYDVFQFNLQLDEASASPDPKTSPRLSRASIFLTQILQVTEEDAHSPPAAAVDLTGISQGVKSRCDSEACSRRP